MSTLQSPQACREATGVDEAIVAQVVERVRPHRPDGRGHAWAACVANHDKFKRWLVEEGLTVVKAGELLAREGTVIPGRTLHRYALEVLEVGRSSKRVTVPVADGEPGVEVQVDFGKMGLLVDPGTGRRRVAHALIFTAVLSRHCFVWLTHTQTTADVIDANGGYCLYVEPPAKGSTDPPSFLLETCSTSPEQDFTFHVAP